LTLRTSSSAKKRFCADLRPLSGLPVFRNGTSAPSSTARIIPARHTFWRKRGGKFLVIGRRRSCSRFFPTKICATSAKRSRRLQSQFFCRKSAVNGPLRLKHWQKSWRAFLLSVGQAHRLLATDAVAIQFPSRHLSAKRSTVRAPIQIQF